MENPDLTASVLLSRTIWTSVNGFVAVNVSSNILH